MNVIETTEKYFMPVAARYPIVIKEGRGCYLYDENGKEYLDALAGIAVNSLGYGHPALSEAIAKQAKTLMHVSNYFYTEVQAKLLQALARSSGMDRVFLCSSGAEAVEGALKLARLRGTKIHPQKYRIVSAENSFHGRTLGALAATGQTKYHGGYEPLLEGFSYVPYGDIGALKAAVDGQTCAVILEPIQGEGGVHPAPEGYLGAAKALCQENGALLILDEIQTGFCRTGEWFAFMAEGIRPDIITCAKGMGGGFPLGAFMSTEAASLAFEAGSHGSTYGGNALACAAALAVLGVMESGNLCASAQQMGALLKQGLQALKAAYPQSVKDVRGRGLLLGFELAGDGKAFAKACLQRGLIVNCTGGGTLRLAPPLIITEKEIKTILHIFEELLKKGAHAPKA